MACSSCAKKAALRNSRVVNRSKKAALSVKKKLNQKSEPKNDGQSKLS